MFSRADVPGNERTGSSNRFPVEFDGGIRRKYSYGERGLLSGFKTNDPRFRSIEAEGEGPVCIAFSNHRSSDWGAGFYSESMLSFANKTFPYQYLRIFGIRSQQDRVRLRHEIGLQSDGSPFLSFHHLLMNSVAFGGDHDGNGLVAPGHLKSTCCIGRNLLTINGCVRVRRNVLDAQKHGFRYRLWRWIARGLWCLGVEMFGRLRGFIAWVVGRACGRIFRSKERGGWRWIAWCWK